MQCEEHEGLVVAHSVDGCPLLTKLLGGIPHGTTIAAAKREREYHESNHFKIYIIIFSVCGAHIYT